MLEEMSGLHCSYKTHSSQKLPLNPPLGWVFMEVLAFSLWSLGEMASTVAHAPFKSASIKPPEGLWGKADPGSVRPLRGRQTQAHGAWGPAASPVSESTVC